MQNRTGKTLSNTETSSVAQLSRRFPVFSFWGFWIFLYILPYIFLFAGMIAGGDAWKGPISDAKKQLSQSLLNLTEYTFHATMFPIPGLRLVNTMLISLGTVSAISALRRAIARQGR